MREKCRAPVAWVTVGARYSTDGHAGHSFGDVVIEHPILQNLLVTPRVSLSVYLFILHCMHSAWTCTCTCACACAIPAPAGGMAARTCSRGRSRRAAVVVRTLHRRSRRPSVRLAPLAVRSASMVSTQLHHRTTRYAPLLCWVLAMGGADASDFTDDSFSPWAPKKGRSAQVWACPGLARSPRSALRR